MVLPADWLKYSHTLTASCFLAAIPAFAEMAAG
jgi:hypothetical protein